MRKTKKEGKKKLIKTEPKDVGHLKSCFEFCGHPIKNVIKHGTSGKKGILLCCKCLFEWIGANLAHSY